MFTSDVLKLGKSSYYLKKQDSHNQVRSLSPHRKKKMEVAICSRVTNGSYCVNWDTRCTPRLLCNWLLVWKCVALRTINNETENLTRVCLCLLFSAFIHSSLGAVQ